MEETATKASRLFNLLAVLSMVFTIVKSHTIYFSRKTYKFVTKPTDRHWILCYYFAKLENAQNKFSISALVEGFKNT